MAVDADILNEFLIESRENIDFLDRELVVLEQQGADPARIGAIFRAVHTFKGTAGFLGLTRLEALTHAGENLLHLVRDGQLEAGAEVTAALLTLVDSVRVIIDEVEATGEEGASRHDEIVATLKRLQRKSVAPAAPLPPQPRAPSVRPVVPRPPSARPASARPPTTRPGASAGALRPSAHAGSKPISIVPPPPRLPTGTPAPAPTPRLGQILVDSGAVSAGDLACALDEQVRDPRSVGEILISQGKVNPISVLDALAVQSDHKQAAAETTVRVDVGLLDKLMNLVGELVLARNQIVQYGAGLKDATFASSTQRLNLLTTELQEGVMKTRLQPIGNVWSKLPRVVRDLAHGCGKLVRLEMVGAETDLDRTILEAIKDPLTHIVRNSIDHGIEAPEVRASHGKATVGVLHLSASHEGGHVVVQIADDGAGIDPEKIRRRAVEKGLVPAERAARMTERELFGLVFLPGFSTAEKVTHVSGRGVGMDVVKTNIERIGGVVDLHSQVGRGTTLRIKIPLTLAIVPALFVTAAGERFAIPQVSLLELVRIDGSVGARAIEHVRGAPVYRLRGRLLPLVFLSRVLGLVPDERVAEGKPLYIVVVQADDRAFGLVVDTVSDTEEIVVKPLGKELKGLTGFAGATIMGDGRVALILDVLGIAERAGVGALSTDSDEAAAIAPDAELGETTMLLLLRVRGDGRMALPLASVARLEVFAHDSVERSGGRDVVQYRGEILQLLDVQSELDGSTAPHDDRPLQVVVTRDAGRPIGLVVEGILDVVEERISVKKMAGRRGVSGAAVVQGKVADLLDVDALTERALRAPTERAAAVA